MTRKTSPDDAPTPPSEFTSFIRRIGIDAFDRFAQKKIETKAATRSNPLQTLASIWLDLTPDEKKRFFDQVIAAGQVAAVAAPAVLARAKQKTEKKKPVEDPAPVSEKPEPKKEKKAKKKKPGKAADVKKDKKSREGKKSKKKD